ncbi:mucin-5AC isoform X3 [Eurytemora carolleeae]|uniref:mucin-5AC isoform X3 n=1 Tax=Eurytemora carolleeae TaxID=1294199 RepID=UPI000C78B9DF|nr:mucin-5AC isoform X3 [Eurytemora carolleeae]|eukprot:XP_023349516.1 mucin-5AC-like isoform X3 [Eurytemora affinis]
METTHHVLFHSQLPFNGFLYSPGNIAVFRIHEDCEEASICTKEGCRQISCSQDTDCEVQSKLPVRCDLGKGLCIQKPCQGDEECIKADQIFRCFSNGSCKPSFGTCVDSCSCILERNMTSGKSKCFKGNCFCRPKQNDCNPNETKDPYISLDILAVQNLSTPAPTESSTLVETPIIETTPRQSISISSTYPFTSSVASSLEDSLATALFSSTPSGLYTSLSTPSSLYTSLSTPSSLYTSLSTPAISISTPASLDTSLSTSLMDSTETTPCPVCENVDLASTTTKPNVTMTIYFKIPDLTTANQQYQTQKPSWLSPVEQNNPHEGHAMPENSAWTTSHSSGPQEHTSWTPNWITTTNSFWNKWAPTSSSDSVWESSTVSSWQPVLSSQGDVPAGSPQGDIPPSVSPQGDVPAGSPQGDISPSVSPQGIEAPGVSSPQPPPAVESPQDTRIDQSTYSSLWK